MIMSFIHYNISAGMIFTNIRYFYGIFVILRGIFNKL